MRLWLIYLLAFLPAAHADIITDVRVSLESRPSPRRRATRHLPRPAQRYAGILESLFLDGTRVLKVQQPRPGGTPYAHKTEQLALQQLPRSLCDYIYMARQTAALA